MYAFVLVWLLNTYIYIGIHSKNYLWCDLMRQDYHLHDLMANSQTTNIFLLCIFLQALCQRFRLTTVIIIFEYG